MHPLHFVGYGARHSASLNMHFDTGRTDGPGVVGVDAAVLDKAKTQALLTPRECPPTWGYSMLQGLRTAVMEAAKEDHSPPITDVGASYNRCLASWTEHGKYSTHLHIHTSTHPQIHATRAGT